MTGGDNTPTRVLVPVDGHWQTGDVVKTSVFGLWGYLTLDRDGWRESSREEKAAYERAMALSVHAARRQ